MSFIENIPEFSWYLLYTAWYLFLILIITLLLQFIVYCCSAYISLVYSVGIEFWDYIILPCYKLFRATVNRIKRNSEVASQTALRLREKRNLRYTEYLESKADEVEAALYEENDFAIDEEEHTQVIPEIERLPKKSVKPQVKKSAKKVESAAPASVNFKKDKSNPYAVFGLSETASLEDCRKAYEELNAAYNPDKYPDMKLLYDQVQKSWQQIQEQRQAKT